MQYLSPQSKSIKNIQLKLPNSYKEYHQIFKKQLMNNNSPLKLAPINTNSPQIKFGDSFLEIKTDPKRMNPQQIQQNKSKQLKLTFEKEQLPVHHKFNSEPQIIEEKLEKLPKKSILGMRLPSMKPEPRNSQITFTESGSVVDDGESVVWNDDDLKVRGILPKIQEEKPVTQFMELYKYRYESFPGEKQLLFHYQNARKEIDDKQVLKAARAYARMNRRAWKKYFEGKEIDFKSNENYTKEHDTFMDGNFNLFKDYVAQVHRQPRKQISKIELNIKQQNIPNNRESSNRRISKIDSLTKIYNSPHMEKKPSIKLKQLSKIYNSPLMERKLSNHQFIIKSTIIQKQSEN